MTDRKPRLRFHRLSGGWCLIWNEGGAFRHVVAGVGRDTLRHKGWWADLKFLWRGRARRYCFGAWARMRNGRLFATDHTSAAPHRVIEHGDPCAPAVNPDDWNAVAGRPL